MTSSSSSSLSIHSPFSGNITNFDNGDSFPDLEMQIPGLDKPIHLHSMVLGQSSKTLAMALRSNSTPCCRYDASARRMVWTYEITADDAVYRNVLVKWLRFCYGEDQTFEAEECPAALVALLHVQLLNCLEKVKESIENFMLEKAKSDVAVGVKMIEACVNRYDHVREKRFRESLFRSVMTKNNFETHFETLSCSLMNMPSCYLDMVEYGDPHSARSEFSMRARYVKYNGSRLDVEEKRKVMRRCKVNELGSEEMEELESMRVLSEREIIDIHRSVLKRRDEEAKEMKEAFDLYQRTVVGFHQFFAENGQVESMYILGVCYANGEGVPQDHKKAVEFYQRAADKGNVNAMFNLGACYANGEGITQDYKKAVEFYQRAADKGNACAMNNLAICYENGEGIAQDYKKAAEFYQRAADKGQVDAMFNLGLCYKNGEGVSQDYNKAVEYYQLAADKGHVGAMYKLGWCFMKGIGVEKDEIKGFQLYQQASNKGNAWATNNLASCYLRGTGVAQDKKKAFELYQQSADGGFGHGFCNVGACYENGDGVKQDVNEAVKMYERGVELCDAGSMKHLGLCYMKGIGVEKDEEKGKELLERAASLGNKRAKAILEEMK